MQIYDIMFSIPIESDICPAGNIIQSTSCKTFITQKEESTMNCSLISLKEQKYMGIKTKIYFKDHDEIDFRKLQQDVIFADIPNIDNSERFMALDSDFAEDSFHYTPLVPVTSFDGEAYFQFTRQSGEYYCFEVQLKDLGPKWFQECSVYIEQNNLKIDRSFDLEYYPTDYMDKLRSGGFSFPEQTISLIFRKVG